MVRRFTFVLELLTLAACASTCQSGVLLLAGSSTESQSAKHDYAGDDACRACHGSKVEGFHTTAHFLTSRPANENSILGSFSSPTNVLNTSNPELVFKMEKTEKGFFQTAVEGKKPNTSSRSERFDLVVGSGGKGQTYLYWQGDRLFELPVSYWKDLGWVNSPGYLDGVAEFNRPIIPRCLECHATYFEANPGSRNSYSHGNFVLGITCEKCHGDGTKHVAAQSSKAGDRSAHDLPSPAKWARQQQLDLCAWCHAGAGRNVVPAFSYIAGQPLANYIEFPPAAPNAKVDVHGSQVELLEKSKCFQSSAMTCTTCHDVHRPQHDLAEFSQRCLGCHEPSHCGKFAALGSKIAQNCIDCHMPRQATNLIVFNRNGPPGRPLIRNHWIGIYKGQDVH